ncbi:MAG: hypothetical protein D4R40_02675 [Nitrosomonadaceae bacterium]|nr:MAG: hypothetical protein D4R40_02675 [Nitrosomonadaceae bacterium]
MLMKFFYTFSFLINNCAVYLFLRFAIFTFCFIRRPSLGESTFLPPSQKVKKKFHILSINSSGAMSIDEQMRLQCNTDFQCDFVELLPLVTFNTQPIANEKPEQKRNKAYNNAITVDEINKSLKRHGL